MRLVGVVSAVSLGNLTGTPQYLSWLARKVRPYVGDHVLELGAGIGNITGRLMGRRFLYVAAERSRVTRHHPRLSAIASVRARTRRRRACHHGWIT